MKYFVKQSVSVTTVNKPKVVAPTSGTAVKDRTTPNKQLGEQKGIVPKMKIKNTTIEKKAGGLRDDWQNLKYLTKHKYYIIGPGRELGLSWGQLLKHDLSKFSPKEWEPYSNYFFNSDGKYNPRVLKQFIAAKQHHFEKNPHHWNVPGLELKYRLEKVVDWYSAAKTQSADPQSFPKFKEWYMLNRDWLSKQVDAETDSYIINKIT